MRCFLCNQAETVPGLTSVLLERGHLSLTVTDVPAHICPRCNEAYADEIVTTSLLYQAEKLVSAGMKVGVRAYTRADES